MPVEDRNWACSPNATPVTRPVWSTESNEKQKRKEKGGNRNRIKRLFDRLTVSDLKFHFLVERWSRFTHRWGWEPQSTVCKCRLEYQSRRQPNTFHSDQTPETLPADQQEEEDKKVNWFIALACIISDIPYDRRSNEASIYSVSATAVHTRIYQQINTPDNYKIKTDLIGIIQSNGLKVLQLPQIPQLQRAILSTYNGTTIVQTQNY